ncbi:hypothetical protein P7K49_009938, partial [Saguinus oedipus]
MMHLTSPAQDLKKDEIAREASDRDILGTEEEGMTSYLWTKGDQRGLEHSGTAVDRQPQ